MSNPAFTRRDFLSLAAASTAALSVGMAPGIARAATPLAHPLAARAPQFPAKATQMIFLCLSGGMSHVDTFDYKPELQKNHHKTVQIGKGRKQTLLGSPFAFTPRGQSGKMVSEIFPTLGGIVDDLCFVHSMYTDHADHFPATLALHTGSTVNQLPSFGTWIGHALGTDNINLPPYVVITGEMPYAGAQVWDNSFLPAYSQGVRVVPGPEPLANLRSPVASESLRTMERSLLRRINERHASARPEDLNLAPRTMSYDTAAGMMRQAPAVFDLAGETDATLESYGLKRGESSSFAWSCLVARRMIESGVRVVELFDRGASNNWDAHGNINSHRDTARTIDRALTALITDLRQRGMLESTLFVCATEFGRTPWPDGETKSIGRSHYNKAFTVFFAGGGTRAGYSHGSTDEFGATIASQPFHLNDFHATILHLMGLNHEKLTYHYGGRDFRLTDLGGVVAHDIIA